VNLRGMQATIPADASYRRTGLKGTLVPGSTRQGARGKGFSRIAIPTRFNSVNAPLSAGLPVDEAHPRARAFLVSLQELLANGWYFGCAV